MKLQTNNNVIVIAGQTASGKSDLAVSLALYIIKHKKQYGVSGAEIISADSRQVYTGLDIGSGKITDSEMKGVPHHMLSITSPLRTYTVSQYQKKVTSIIKKLHSQNSIPIICGGTGFYIDSLIYQYALPTVKPDVLLRKTLEKLSTEDLVHKLSLLDPERIYTIDIHNRVRLIRAIEIETHAPHSLSPLPKTSPYRTLWIGASFPSEIITKRIHTRLIKRLAHGMIQEVEHLHTHHHVSYTKLESFGLEYRHISRYLQGVVNCNQMISLLEKDIVRYAKRQMTWFKKNKDIHWLTPPFYKNSLPLIKKFL